MIVAILFFFLPFIGFKTMFTEEEHSKNYPKLSV